MTSEAKIAANKLNAQRSTGPRTPEGKETSRGNALRHGLSGGYVVVAKALGGILRAAVNELRKDTQPRNLREEAMLEQIAVDCFRIEYCQSAALTLLVRSWDESCRAAAVRLAHQLASDPLLAVLLEEVMPRRAPYVLRRCALIVAGVQEGRLWTTDERALAFDLVGALRAERVTRAPSSVPVTDHDADQVEDWGGYVDALERFLRARDVRDRWTTLLGLPRDYIPSAPAIERYEVGAEGRIRRTLQQWQESRWRVDLPQGVRLEPARREHRPIMAVPTAL